MTDKPKFPVQELLHAGPNAPKVLIRHIVEADGKPLTERVRKEFSPKDMDVEEYLDRLVKSQLMLARSQGAGAGAITTMAEMSSAVTGPGAVGVAVTTILADLTALAWIQIRLSLMIASAYGHDLEDVEMRAREILMLHGLETATGNAAGPAVGKASGRVGKRLLMKYLKGDALVAVKAMFRLVGIKFSRAAVVRGLPLINIPANAAVADLTTRRSAAKVRKYYRTLPVAGAEDRPKF